jgi:hypothetical protein
MICVLLLMLVLCPPTVAQNPDVPYSGFMLQAKLDWANATRSAGVATSDSYVTSLTLAFPASDRATLFFTGSLGNRSFSAISYYGSSTSSYNVIGLSAALRIYIGKRR